MFKRDLKRAYRQMFINPGDVHLLGFKFDGLYYFDTTLTMGMRSSADICQRNMDAIMHIYHNEGCEGVNYLKDMASAERNTLAWATYDKLEKILEQLNIQKSHNKACPPSTCMFFGGEFRQIW